MSTDHDATNRRIAEAMGWTDFRRADHDVGHWAGRNPAGDYRVVPDYAHDADAMLAAAAEIVGDVVLWTCDVGWACWKSSKYPPEFEPPNGDTPALALCAMIEAWLDEQEKK